MVDTLTLEIPTVKLAETDVVNQGFELDSVENNPSIFYEPAPQPRVHF